ncbi:MAG TPA: 6-phosphogluconolactonase [Candidatus Polarisedimenticolia bacterium]|jgi:6-phosphogluconolactonase|nr:6-phosphogluconolactonase [Candidatus Polarisedimenticolia bacterium]
MATDLSRDPGLPCNPIVVAPEEFAGTAADHVARSLHAAALERERIGLALSGGTGPRPVYEALARIPGLPWGMVEIYFADERAVPPDQAESNFRLVKESLLDRLPAPPAAIHRMEGERPDVAGAAADYERLLPPRLDVLVLGIGADGHTASLFPQDPAVREDRRRVLAVRAPVPPEWRITVTPPVIGAARTRLVLAAGEGKARAVARACAGPWGLLACPAQLARNATWIVDEPAASRLHLGDA